MAKRALEFVELTWAGSTSTSPGISTCDHNRDVRTAHSTDAVSAARWEKGIDPWLGLSSLL
eukprot:2907800-Rhodomonas_salina.3